MGCLAPEVRGTGLEHNVHAVWLGVIVGSSCHKVGAWVLLPGISEHLEGNRSAGVHACPSPRSPMVTRQTTIMCFKSAVWGTPYDSHPVGPWQAQYRVWITAFHMHIHHFTLHMTRVISPDGTAITE
jgi:hypothetical protein